MRGLGSFLARGHEAPTLVSRGGLGFGTTALKRNFFDDSCMDSVVALWRLLDDWTLEGLATRAPSLSFEFRDPIERRKRAFDQMFEINKRSWVLRRYASR
jgi:hypothetical protein